MTYLPQAADPWQAPGALDAAAAALVAALRGVASGEINEAAVDALGPFSTSDRDSIAEMAIQQGADRNSVQMAVVAAGASDSSEVIQVVSTIPKIVKARPWLLYAAIAAAIGAAAYAGQKQYKRKRRTR